MEKVQSIPKTMANQVETVQRRNAAHPLAASKYDRWQTQASDFSV
jgi:hypothetical protein